MLPERYHRLRTVLDRRQPDLTVLMERVNKEHNFSAILRNCDAVGVLEAHAVFPDRGLTLHRDTSGGTAKWIRVHRHEEGPAAIDQLRDEGFQLIAAHPSPGALDYRKPDYTRPTAFVMGAELFGVSEASLAAVDQTVLIPMLGMVRSLNVSVATALLLYEAQRQREAAGMYDAPRLDPERHARILFEWCRPGLARRLGDAGLPYPPLGPEGELPEGFAFSVRD